MKLSKSDSQRLREWAQLLYCKENRSQIDIAETVGVSARTINQWKTDGKWDELRKSLLQTKEEQLKDLYAQVEQFNTFIKTKPEGYRFPDSKEADALKKMTSSIKDLETELNISVIIDVGIDLVAYIREFDFNKAKDVADWIDRFIKSKV